MRAILHIGTEKTGTTTIQNGLVLNKENLLKQGIYLPESLCSVGMPQNHFKLACYALNDNKIEDIRLFEGIKLPSQVEPYRQMVFEMFQREMEQVNQEIVLMSSEHCSSRLIEHEEIVRLKNFLDHFFEHITIVIYLRKQEDFLASSYSTSIRCGLITNFPSAEEFAMYKDRYDYYHILNKWSEVFGKNNIKVFIYDSHQLKENDIFTDFCDRLQIKDVTKPTIRYNESLNLTKLDLMKEVNKYISQMCPEKADEIKLGIIKIIESFDVQGPSVKQLLTKEYYHLFDESNCKVAREYLGREDGVLFYSEHRESDHSTKQSLDAVDIVDRKQNMTGILSK